MPEIHVNDVFVADLLLKFLARNHHGERFAVRGSKAIEVAFRFQRRSGPLGERQQDIAALDVIAGVFDLPDRNVRPHDQHLHAAFILPHRSHLVEDGELPLRPFDSDGVLDRPDDGEFVAHFHALAGAFVDVDVVALVERDLGGRLLAGDHVGVARDGFGRDHSRTIDVVPVAEPSADLAPPQPSRTAPELDLQGQFSHA